MIARKHHKAADKKDSFRDLAEYIAAAREEGEKLDDLWLVNFDAGEGLEDLESAIQEALATQALNQRAGPCKSYHISVSFRPGEKPDREALDDMERAFAKALGFEEHQRVVGVHEDTDNYHFHVGYNRIHPKMLLAHTPRNDYRALEAVCREMERRHGLYVDIGMSDYKSGRAGLDRAARDYEVLTWEQSFQNYVLENRAALLHAAADAGSWEDLHAAAAEIGVAFRKRGNGLAVVNVAADTRN